MLAEPPFRHVELPDGRVLEAVNGGPENGMPLVFQNGTPTAAMLFAPLVETAAARGLRTVMYSRPGYAGSTPHPGRSVADAAADIAAILDANDADRFVTIGWSGGGPHALACAALLPERCAAAVSLAGVAPHGAGGLDWLAGMGPENVEEFTAALAGEAALTRWLEAQAGHLASVHGNDIVASLGGLLPDVDKASLTGDFAEYMAYCFRRAVSSGISGWRDDDLAFAKPWGFELDAITRPVAVWQGGQDLMVPVAHGEWLAAHIPGAHKHIHQDEGHLSLGVAALPRIVDDLIALAG